MITHGALGGLSYTSSLDVAVFHLKDLSFDDQILTLTHIMICEQFVFYDIWVEGFQGTQIEIICQLQQRMYYYIHQEKDF